MIRPCNPWRVARVRVGVVDDVHVEAWHLTVATGPALVLQSVVDPRQVTGNDEQKRDVEPCLAVDYQLERACGPVEGVDRLLEDTLWNIATLVNIGNDGDDMSST